MHKFVCISVYMLFAIQISFAQFSHILFSENKNQWPSQVLFRSPIPEGFVYLEKNCITYHAIDFDNVIAAHPAHAAQAQVDIESLTTSLQQYKNGKNVAPQPFFELPSKDAQMVRQHVYKVYFKNMNRHVTVVGEKMQEGIENYYIGNDPAKWAQGVRTFEAVRYKQIYRNIDFKMYDYYGRLKYDFIVYPGGKPNRIELLYTGVEKMSITHEGNLVIHTSINQIHELKPYAFQIINGEKIEISCEYHLSHFTLSFTLGEYSKNHVLYIDPELIFSTFSGSVADEWGFTATYDHDNNAYGGGIVSGFGYPVSQGALQTQYGGGNWDISIIKFNPTGTQRLYATYLGGNSSEMPHSLIVNKNNELLILGTTSSPDFPMVNSFNPTFKGGRPILYNHRQLFENGVDIFIAKLAPDGTQILASTFMNGTDNDGINFNNETNLYYGHDSLYYNYADGARGEIMLDRDDNIYVATTTFSTDFPMLNAAQPVSGGSQEAVIFKFNPDLSQLQWSTYFGGESKDAAYSVDIDTSGNVFVTGGTCSQSIVSLPGGGFIPTRIGGTVDAFVLSINAETGAFQHATYFGSTFYDQAHFVRVNQLGDVFIFGQTTAPGSTLIFNAPYNRPNSGQFLASFSNNLSSLNWSTVFGTGIGRPNITPTAFEVDICNRIYLAGSGRDWPQPTGWYFDPVTGFYEYDLGWLGIQGTKNMDITPDAFQSVTDGKDFYFMVIDDQAQSLDYATFLGEVTDARIYSIDGFNVIFEGCENSGRDHVDGGTSRFDSKGYIYQSVCAGCGGCATGFPIKPDPGAWSNTNNSINCNQAVVRFFIDFGLLIPDFDLPELTCETQELQFTNKTEAKYNNPLLFYTWDFGDGSPVSHDEHPTHIYQSEGTYTVKLIVQDSSACNQLDSITKQISIVTEVNQEALPIQNICEGESVEIGIPQEYNPDYTYEWIPSTGLSHPDRPQTIANPTETTEYSLIVSEAGWCRTEYTQTVVVHTDDYAIIEIEVESQNEFKNPVCHNQMVTLRAITNRETSRYVWSTSPTFNPVLNPDFTQSSITVPADFPRTYYVRTFSAFCDFIDQSSVFVYVSYNDIHAKGDTIICEGDFAELTVENLIPGNALTYHWIPDAFVANGQGTEHVYVNPPRTTLFYVYATNQDNCVVVDSVLVQVHELRIDTYFFDQISCFGETDGRIYVNPQGTPNFTYEWENGHTGPERNNLGAGTYTVTVEDDFGCIVQREFVIIEPELLQIIDTSLYFTTCSATCNGALYADVRGGTLPYTFLWNNGETTPLIENLCVGIYTLSVIDAHGCEVTFTEPAYIGLHERLPYVEPFVENPILYRGQSTNFHAAPHISDTITYHWDPNLWLDSYSEGIVFGAPLETMTYYVTASDRFGCTSMDTVTVTVHDWVCDYPYIFVPTAFSPNNDGVNDVLQIKSGVITDLQFEVFDRWGELVFSTNDVTEIWDGSYRGKPLHPQVLVYYIRATCLDQEEFVAEGNITILK